MQLPLSPSLSPTLWREGKKFPFAEGVAAEGRRGSERYFISYNTPTAYAVTPLREGNLKTHISN